jgi:hypothetical protein
MYRIPPLKQNFLLLQNLSTELVIGSVFHVNEIILNSRKKVSDRVYLTFTVKDNKDTTIKYKPRYNWSTNKVDDTKPYTQYYNLSCKEFNELQYAKHLP